MRFKVTHRPTQLGFDFSIDVTGLSKEEIVASCEQQIQEILDVTNAPREAFEIIHVSTPY